MWTLARIQLGRAAAGTGTVAPATNTNKQTERAWEKSIGTAAAAAAAAC